MNWIQIAFIIYCVSCGIAMVVYSILTQIIRENVKDNEIDSNKIFRIGFSISPFIPGLNSWVSIRFIISLFRNRFNIKKMKKKALEGLVKDNLLEQFTGKK